LQEIKCTNAAFPHRALKAASYGAIWAAQGPHHGVAILARSVDPIETARELPGDKRDREARYIEAAIEGVVIGCLYLPNGNPQPGPKFAYKMAWFERFIAHANALRAANVPVILDGDYNSVADRCGYLQHALVEEQRAAAAGAARGPRRPR
jgi:exodeoxyribonuclease III